MSQTPPPLPPDLPSRWAPDDAVDEPLPGRPPRQGRPTGFALIAWAVIAVTVAGMITLAQLAASMAPPGAPATGESFEVTVMRMQMKLNVGAANLDPNSRGQILQQAAMFNSGPIDQRLLFIPVAAELGDSQEAAETLQTLLADLESQRDVDAELDPQDPAGAPVLATTESQDAVIEVFERLYPIDGEHTEDAHLARVEALDQADRDLLTTELEWIGELALTPPGSDAAARDIVLGSAQMMAMVMVLLMVVGFTALGLGFIGLIVLMVLAFAGRLKSGIQPGHVHHGIYAETFAIWLLVFVVCQVAAEVASLAAPNSGLGLAAAGFFVSLIVLVYPVMRGRTTWSLVRQDIGLTWGRHPFAEPFIGLGGYVMGIPIAVVGILMTLGLMLAKAMLDGASPDDAFAPGNTPAHPIVGQVGGSLWGAVQLYLVASVAAPVVEETMFRGVLYRHLRDASRSLGLIVSIVLGTLINAFVFAAIHPQGMLAIPALMSLAIAFTLAREWRGTLIPAIIMHGVSNGIIMTMILLLVGS